MAAQYGECIPQKGGTSILQLPRDVAVKLRAAMRHFDQMANVYAVLAEDGHVITTAHRFQTSQRKARKSQIAWRRSA